MKSVEIDDVTGTLAEYMESVDELPLIVTRDGQPVAALVPIRNADMESVTLANNPEFLKIIERSRTRYRIEGGIPGDQIRSEFDKQ